MHTSVQHVRKTFTKIIILVNLKNNGKPFLMSAIVQARVVVLMATLCGAIVVKEVREMIKLLKRLLFFS
jgi:hypothetical protein